ncbi:DUF805 domain-containing protein [Aurantiacibacter suaedae]|uniref:DUF805 domain-containing protein n=1 Tax=Aurantiacibacter suaedae TaxID=2545755 RepID=UPI0010F8E5BA|nr:DUF805 domain-containing protein [Aurantiacibacter suaedae]
MEWMLMPLRKYAQFSGRSRRKEFWMFALLNMIVYSVVIGLMVATSGASAFAGANSANPLAIYTSLFTGVGLLLAVWALAVFIPSIAVSVRRLHDRDMSGWWYLGFIVASMIPFIGLIASIAFIVIMALPGTPGPNRYGPDPKDPGSAEVFR